MPASKTRVETPDEEVGASLRALAEVAEVAPSAYSDARSPTEWCSMTPRPEVTPRRIRISLYRITFSSGEVRARRKKNL